MNKNLIFFLLFIKSLHFINGVSEESAIRIPKIWAITTRSESFKYENDILRLPSDMEIKLYFVGENMNEADYVAFSYTNSKFGQNCEIEKSTRAFKVVHENDHSAYAFIKFEFPTTEGQNLSICMRTFANSNSKWYHQESSKSLLIETYQKEVKLPLGQFILFKILFILLFISLFLLSGLFSGLNLGLMSLDNTDLSLLVQAGEEDEKKYAKKIQPIRKRGNFLLCSLLIVNVVVNNILALLTDNLIGNGMISVVLSSTGIVLFGEIIPQAICSRHGLLVGAKTIIITKFIMLITGIVSFPLGKLLDLILGEELRTKYNRKELDALIKDQQQQGLVDKEEAGIIEGALQINTKQVHQIMTKINDVYMLPYNLELDYNVISEIGSKGYSRIPLYHEDRNNVIGILNVKDLITVNLNYKISLSTLCKYYMHAIIRVKFDTCLKNLFELFVGGRSHLALLEDNNNELIGIVTLEDIIEEIFQREIVDETDLYTDNVYKRRPNIINRDFRTITGFSDSINYPISMEYKQALFRFLVSEIDVFNSEIISVEILQSFLNADVIFEHKYHSDRVNSLYSIDKEANYAILVLKGELNVTAEFNSNEFKYQAGPFKLLGQSVLKKGLENYRNHADMRNNSFLTVPLIEKVSNMSKTFSNFNATMTGDVQYMKITVEQYIFAVILTAWQREGRISEQSFSVQNNHNYFQLEWNKLFKSKAKGSTANHTIIDVGELRRTESM